jgi:acyl-CoA thioester hydrolase
MSSPRQRLLSAELVITVQPYDIDFAGIVSNIVYVRWLEDLRVQLLANSLPLKPLVKQGIAPILTSTQIDYRRSIKFFDHVVGHVWVKEFRRLKWTLEMEILANETLVTTATQIGVFIDLQTGRPVPIPADLAQQYAQLTAND